jgi:hypothetical protein
VTSSGDINGDGLGDLVVGFGWTGGSVETLAGVYLGTPNIFFNSSAEESAVPSFSLAGTQNAVGDIEVSLANAGDVNGDGYDDVVVGGDRFMSLTGQAYVYLGAAGSLGLPSSPSLAIAGPGGPNQYFGAVVAGPGDVNGDGYSDVMVSDEKGHAYLFEGSPTGISPTAAAILPAPDDATTIFGPTLAD